MRAGPALASAVGTAWLACSWEHAGNHLPLGSTGWKCDVRFSLGSGIAHAGALLGACRDARVAFSVGVGRAHRWGSLPGLGFGRGGSAGSRQRTVTKLPVGLYGQPRPRRRLRSASEMRARPCGACSSALHSDQPVCLVGLSARAYVVHVQLWLSAQHLLALCAALAAWC